MYQNPISFIYLNSIHPIPFEIEFEDSLRELTHRLAQSGMISWYRKFPVHPNFGMIIMM